MIAFTYLALKHHVHGTFIDEVLCPACLEETPEAARTPHDVDKDGYEQIVKPWTGDPRECSVCGRTPAQVEAKALAISESVMADRWEGRP